MPTAPAGAIGNFFREPPPLPSISSRVQAALAAIDWSRRDIVIWLPGTSEHFIHAGFRDAVRGAMGVDPVLLDYPATWRLVESMADGRAVLRALLEAIQQRDPDGRHRVHLAGQSQGAWIISDVIHEPRFRNRVHRAALFGHPALATHHVHGAHARIREFNNPGDPVVTPLAGDSGAVLAAISDAARGRVLAHLGTLLQTAAGSPRILGNLFWTAIRNLPPLARRFPDPHVYDGHMQAAARFLRSGQRAGDSAA